MLELIKDIPVTTRVQFKSELEKERLVERSLNGVTKRLSASASDLAGEVFVTSILQFKYELHISIGRGRER